MEFKEDQHFTSPSGEPENITARGVTTAPASRIRKRCRTSQGNLAFTLIELVIVIAIVALLFAFVAINPRIFPYWREEGFLRRLSETLVFLHHQAVYDQLFYQIEFTFGERDQLDSWKVGALAPVESTGSSLGKSRFEQGLGGQSGGRQGLGSGGLGNSGLSKGGLAPALNQGALTMELAKALHPAMGQDMEFGPPPSIPSLGEAVEFPPSVKLRAIRTMRGKKDAIKAGKAHIVFSPKGFSEFAVLHIELSGGQKVTLLVNPFNGEVESYRGDEFKEFEWSYGKDKKSR